MISIARLRLYRPVQSLLIPPVGIEGRNVCMSVFSENEDFLEGLNHLNIRPQYIRYVYVPTTKYPRTRLTGEYRKELISHHLRSVKGLIGDYSKVIGKNFYLDLTTFSNAVAARYHLTKFRAGRAFVFMRNIIETLNGVPKDSFIRILLYTVNLDNPITPSSFYRKSYVLYNMLLQKSKGKIEELPFDKLILYFYDHTGGRYVLLYDENLPLNPARVRNVFTKLQSADFEGTDDQEIEDNTHDMVATSALTNGEDSENQNKIKSSIKSFINADPKSKSIPINFQDPKKLITTSLLYNKVGDVDKAKSLANVILNKPDNEVQDLVSSYVNIVVPRPEIKSGAGDPEIRAAKPEDLVDHEIPSQVLEKRKIDFSKQLTQDLVQVFEPLEQEQIPIRVKSIEKKIWTSPIGDLNKTVKDIFRIKLEDSEKKIHNVEIQFPHLTENGTFLINGLQKVLVNQLISYPIFFYKPYFGRLETIYAVITIHSKKLAKSAYLMIHMAGYILPAMMIFGYKIGFERTMKMFGIKYSISKEKTPDSVRLPDGTFISFSYKDESGRQLIESFMHCIPSFPPVIDLNSEDFWIRTLTNKVGTRNCIYPIDQVWKYIVTPVEKRILQAKGDPTKIEDIMKYICAEVVSGHVDDRNSLEKQRIRTSEVFIHTVQKQVISAYNEFLAKKLGGDDTARIRINSTSAYSDVTNSPNVQTLENINPLEELSMMTRVTPIGIGGIPDIEAFPKVARSIHSTYYGNIDPLETPDGPGVGIQQHLSTGVSISNVRGLFALKDPSMVKPTGILSVGPAMIPFVESNDGARVLMGTAQSKQAVPLLSPEIPMIESGYESLLTPLLSDNFIKKSPTNGIISAIGRDIILVKGTRGSYPVDIASVGLKSGSGLNGLSVFRPVVKVGQKVKTGEVIAEGGNIVDGLISNGINLLTAFMPWKGFNFEDGVVVSESVAKKFISMHIERKEVILQEDEDVITVANIGDEIEKGGVLVTYTNVIYDVESYKSVRSESGGIVSNIEVFSNIPDQNIPKKLLPAYEEFKKKFILINKKYPIGHFTSRQKFVGIMIRFTIEERFKLNLGDKLNNRHGNKGVIGLIEKEENMPVTPWGEKIEIVLNPLGIINRMNNGQILELHTGLISRKLGELAIKLPRKNFLPIYSKILTKLDGTENQRYSRNVLNFMASISNRSYQDFVLKVQKRGFIPLIFPPFKSPPRDRILEALAMLGLKPRYQLYLPEFKSKTSPIAVGYQYLNKLEHMSEKKIHSRGVGTYVARTLAPVAGKRRGGGQSLGEHDAYGFLVWDVPYVLEEFFGALSSDHQTKNQLISEIVQKGKTNFQEAKANPVKEMLGQYMAAIHLESE